MDIKDFKYVRIQGRELAENTLYAKGIFSMCWGMIQKKVMEQEDEDLFREVDAWFADILPWPPQCQRRENVVCFFKTENSEMMLKFIKPAMWLLEKYDHPYYVVYTNTPGEIVYEDEYQIVVKAGEPLQIEEMPEPWGIESAKKNDRHYDIEKFY